MASSVRRLLAAVVSSLFCSWGASGCAADETSGPSGPTCSVPAGQESGAACCTGHGEQACVPKYFCAAFDGPPPYGVVPSQGEGGGGGGGGAPAAPELPLREGVCQKLRTQAAGDPCGADDQCAIGSCNVEVGRCPAAFGEPCDAAVGCAQSAESPMFVHCAESGMCEFSSGESGAPCGDSSQCEETAELCIDGTCACEHALGAPGICRQMDVSSCTTTADCPDGLKCIPYYTTDGKPGLCWIPCTASSECPSPDPEMMFEPVCEPLPKASTCELR